MFSRKVFTVMYNFAGLSLFLYFYPLVYFRTCKLVPEIVRVFFFCFIFPFRLFIATVLFSFFMFLVLIFIAFFSLFCRKIVIKIGKKKKRKPESSEEESDDDPPPRHSLKAVDSVRVNTHTHTLTIRLSQVAVCSVAGRFHKNTGFWKKKGDTMQFVKRRERRGCLSQFGVCHTDAFICIDGNRHQTLRSASAASADTELSTR